MNEEIYPLTFNPVFKDYIWGGRNLETKLGRDLPPGKVAESWEISGHPSSSTKVANGPLAGQSLPEVMDLLGQDLVGSRSQTMLARGKFPLLIKLLDANRRLSVQVHPDDAYATKHEDGELGKTEMWYVLHAEPDARLIYGLQEGVSPGAFREALHAGQLEKCLHQLQVKAGDAIFIPSGSIHAIMEGLIIAEIQQNSDTTYRVYDWNRVGDDGKPRPLHIDKALDVIDFELVEPGPFIPELVEETDSLRREVISTCPYFTVERLTFDQTASFKGDNDGSTFEIWGAMTGQAQVEWRYAPLDLPSVRFGLLPAALGNFEIKVPGPATLLRVYVPAA
jgi:mannose-6-phosphate isomerase